MTNNMDCEWGGSLSCFTSDGRIVNVAEELNRLQKEKNELDRRKLEDQILRDLINSSSSYLLPYEESTFEPTKFFKDLDI